MAGKVTGFWSYVRLDNEGDHGRILALSDDLKQRYRIETGEELDLFVDRESIEWGQAWEERIDTAIAGTTFFIPIITPSYFQSPACRQELLKFAREADRLGLGKLLMSVYWVTVPELKNPEASSDEAIGLVAKYNWWDFRDESLEDRDSSPYRKGVAGLARELVKRTEIAQALGDVPAQALEDVPAPVVHIGRADDRTDRSPPEDSPPDDSEEEPRGILENLAATEDALPVAGGLLSEITSQLQIINGQLSSASDDLEAAASRGQGMKAVLVRTNRLAKEMSEPASSIAGSGHEYGKVLGEIDPGVHDQLDIIEAKGEQTTRDDVEYLEAILEAVEATHETHGHMETLLSNAEEAAKLSRSLRAPIGELRAGITGVLDGRAVIDEWGRRAEELMPDEGQDDLDRNSQ